MKKTNGRSIEKKTLKTPCGFVNNISNNPTTRFFVMELTELIFPPKCTFVSEQLYL